MSVKTKKPNKKIAAIRANLLRYGGYELKEFPHPEREDCYLFSITHPNPKNLIHCELVYSPSEGWQLKKSQYSDQQAVIWVRKLIHQTLQGRLEQTETGRV